MEYSTAVHEYMNRRMDRWVDRMYSDSLDALGSTCIIFLWRPLIFSYLLCGRHFETRWCLICPTQSGLQSNRACLAEPLGSVAQTEPEQPGWATEQAEPSMHATDPSRAA